MQHAFVPYSWNTDDQETDPQHYWEIPGAAGPPIDLRTIPEMGTPGPTPQGFAFAAFENLIPLPSGSIPLGDGLSRSLTQGEKNTIKAELSLGENIVADDLLSVLRELLIQHADPTGQTRFKPLMPTVNGMVEIYLGGHRILIELYDPVTHPLVLQLVHLDYRRIQLNSLAGLIRTQDDAEQRALVDPQYHRRYLQKLAEKYGRWLNWEQLIPSDLPRESPLSHGTTLTESWNCTNASNTMDCDLTWDIETGSFDIDTNRVEADSGNPNRGRVTSALAGDDHFAEVSILTQTSDRFGGALARYEDASNGDRYWAITRRGTSQWEMRKTVSTVETELGANSTGWAAPNDNVQKMDCDGSSMETFEDDSSKITATDTAITGETLTGILIHKGDNADRSDRFKAEDKVAAGGRMMGALAGLGGLAGQGGIAGKGGGIAG